MNDGIPASRLRISRRRALALGGSVGLGALIAACSSTATGTTNSGAPGSTADVPSPTPPVAQITTPTTAAGAGVVSTTVPVSSLAGQTSTIVQTSTVTDDAILALLDSSSSCTLTPEETEGPYYIDLDAIRTDIREDRPGVELTLAVRVQDPSCAAKSGAVVEIWHCDAGGQYSGFESASIGGGPGRGGPPGGRGGGSATATDDGTYLRGAQVTNDAGVAQFTTIYPGWYPGRSVHVHFKVHIDENSVLTSQLFFDDAISDALYAAAPYNEHTGERTTNGEDNLFDDMLVVTTREAGGAYTAVHNVLVAG